jgi:hypothetical protein
MGTADQSREATRWSQVAGVGDDDVDGLTRWCAELLSAPASVQLVSASSVCGDYSSQRRLDLRQVVRVHAVALQCPLETVQHLNPLPGGPRGLRHRHLHATLLDDLVNSHDLDHSVDDFDRR